MLAIPREEVILASRQGGDRRRRRSSRRSSPGSRRPRATRTRRCAALVFDSPLRRLQGRRLLRPARRGHAPRPRRHPADGRAAPRPSSSSWACSGPQLVPVKRLVAGEVGLRRDRAQERPRGPGRRHRDDRREARHRAAARATRRRRASCSRASTRSAAPTTRCSATPSRSSTSTTRRFTYEPEIVGRARVRVPVRVPRPAPHGDRPGAAGARVQPRPHRQRAVGRVPGAADDGPRHGHRRQPGQVPRDRRDRDDRGAVGQPRRRHPGPLHRAPDGAHDRPPRARSRTWSTSTRSASTCTSSCRWPS